MARQSNKICLNFAFPTAGSHSWLHILQRETGVVPGVPTVVMSSSHESVIVSPGELITNDSGFMRGHGTYLSNGSLIASVSGEIDRVSKLISVKAPRTRYTAEVGDVVVGRIIEVSNKRWRVDCNARQDSSLLLSAIHLPGVIQRRKSESDELQMRCFFAEGEVLVAEVQMLYHDGAFGIHTRNLKYGKLVAGELIIVKASLVRRSRSHFVVTAWGVEIILGLNGYIWVGKPRKLPDEQDLDALYSRDLGPISKAELDAIARTRNCIVALDSKFKIIDEDSISRLYHATCSIPAHNILCLESLEY